MIFRNRNQKNRKAGIQSAPPQACEYFLLLYVAGRLLGQLVVAAKRFGFASLRISAIAPVRGGRRAIQAHRAPRDTSCALFGNGGARLAVAVDHKQSAERFHFFSE